MTDKDTKKSEVGKLMTKDEFNNKRKLWYRFLKRMIRIRYKRPTFTYLGEKPTKRAIILSNHEGAASPLILETYADFPIRMWGTEEMNSGIKRLYKYQTQIYYHKKRSWNIHLARLFCLIASPLTYSFYKGLGLISTYTDRRFFKLTIPESIKAMDNNENIVIFPEYSDEGYFQELKSFYSGFVVLAKSLYNRGTDVPIYVAYYKKKEREFVFDKPVFFSELQEKCKDRKEMAAYLLDKCNALWRQKIVQ